MKPFVLLSITLFVLLHALDCVFGKIPLIPHTEGDWGQLLPPAIGAIASAFLNV